MKKPKYIPPFGDIPAERQKMPELPLEERRGNFKEVELGFDEETALKEAVRCLSCRRCIGCGLCLAECDQEAVAYDETARDVNLEADAVIFTSDGEPYDPVGKPELGYAASTNVITSLEFERLASPTGPFGGYILRPFDGERPRRIAFIQCVGSRDESIGANYCSVTCCSRTFSQARQAKKHLGEVEMAVFHKGLRPTGKRSELDLAELEAADWVDLIACEVESVKEDPATGTVIVTYTSEGKQAEVDFDLVVLAVGMTSKADFRRQARTAGLKTNKYGFVGRGLPELVADTGSVAFAGTIEGPMTDGTALIHGLGAVGKCLAPGRVARGDRPGGGNGEIAVFACQYGLELGGKDGGGVEALESAGVTLDGSYPFLCYKEGRLAMAEKLASGGRLIVVGCHRASHEGLFEEVLGLGPGRVAIVGIDELDRAGERVRASIQALKTPPEMAPGPKRVVIVGGGTSGLAAASELLRRDIEVVLIDKAPAIGASFLKAFQDAGGEAAAGEGFVKSIQDHPKARVFTASCVNWLKRSAGKMMLEIATSDGEERVEAGAVLIAVGAARYEPTEYPYGKHPGVIDQWELTARIGEGKTDAGHVVMIQCVGARDGAHPYCSRYCCKQAISNALLYKSAKPEAEITILHKGIRVFGLEEDLLADAVEKGIKFVEVAGPPEVDGGKRLKVNATPETGRPIVLDADLVALSLAHMHGPGAEDLSKILGAPLDDVGCFASGGAPFGPFRTPADGIFVCGFAREPVMPEEAYVDGLGAAQAIWRRLMG